MEVQKKNILSVWNIFFRDGYPSEQQQKYTMQMLYEIYKK